jgi:hypothetical protein
MSFRSTVRQLKFEYGKQDALSATTAADFLTGRSPATAEAYDRKGAFVGAFVRDEGEAIIAFRIRVREAARALPGAKRIKLGGIAREPRASFPDLFEARGAVRHPQQ